MVSTKLNAKILKLVRLVIDQAVMMIILLCKKISLVVAPKLAISKALDCGNKLVARNLKNKNYSSNGDVVPDDRGLHSFTDKLF